MAKTLALILGIIVILVGLLGFVMNPILGIFMTNAATDILYIVIGLVLVAVALWAPMQSGLWLKIAGAVYLLVWIIALVMGSPVLGIFGTNSATDWLHLVLGVVLVAAGFWAKDNSMMGSSMGSGMNMPMQNSGPRPM